jgi:hypothetical protein
MTQHTPGPWTAKPNVEHGKVYVWTMDPYPNAICVAYIPEARYRGERAANAQLIAAAPDLLAALTECLAGLRELRAANPYLPFTDAVDFGAINAQLAIARATGD